MIIDFNGIEEKKAEKFRGGEKYMISRVFADENNRILMGRLVPGASIGMHTHEGHSETIYVLEGSGKMLFDDGHERLEAGMCHYCPEGHQHSFINDGATDLVFFAVVPRH